MALRLPRYILWLAFLFSFSGCTPSQPVEEPSPAIEATSTPFPTLTHISPTVTLTPAPSPLPTVTSTSQPAPVQPAQDTVFIFIGETVPDGTNFQPGQAFRKTWTLKNGGARIWDEGFALVRTSSSPANETLGSPEQILLPKEVKSGETVQIGADLAAPKQNGRYTVFYRLQDGAGLPVPDSQVWVTITVGNVPAADAAGITARLVNASLQAGEFAVYFCMQLPDGRQWAPGPWSVALLAGQQRFSPTGSRIDPAGATTANKCFSFYFPASAAAAEGPMQLSIDKVELDATIHLEENCANAHAVLTAAHPGLDFACSGPGGFYTHLVKPAGMSTEEADRLIMDTMSSAIYGPWILDLQTD